MTEDEWKAHARHVVQEMQAFTEPFISPISYEMPSDVPRLSGTGSVHEGFPGDPARDRTQSLLKYAPLLVRIG